MTTYARGLNLDPGGNIYISGFFQGTTDFDPGPAVFSLTSADGADLFILKISPSGNLDWVKQVGGIFREDCPFVTTDATGNIYAMGSFGGTVDFDPGPGFYNLGPAIDGSMFVLKLNSAGDFIWAESFGVVPGNVANIIMSPSGNIFITGVLNGTADFDPGPGVYNVTATGTAGAFILKLRSDGSFIWLKVFPARYRFLLLH